MTELEAAAEAGAPTPPEGPKVGPVTFKRDWPDIVKRAWSIRFMAAAVVFTALEAAVPFAQQFGWFEWLPGGIFALISIFIITAAFVARLIVQNNLRGKDD